jgi:hypothetical protein
MDELLEMLKCFPDGELFFTYNKTGNTFVITAAKGRFSRTLELADSDKLEKGAAATVLGMRAIKLVKEKEREAKDARNNQTRGMANP